ncbi:MAG: M56 family metallopeptidase [Clostridia bacterium]
MSNIWEFLAYTLDLTIWVGIIMIIKRIFKKTMSPTWHYGIWSVLAFKAVYSMFLNEITLDSGSLVSGIMQNVERWNRSNYASEFDSLNFFDVTIAFPNSMIDYLFVAYLCGALYFAVGYILNYVKLKRYIKKNSSVNEENNLLVSQVKERYGFKSKPKVLSVQGISTAFICGLFKPTLVLPQNEIVDEKVLIHEFVHLKSKDNLKSIFWCVLRCLNWCNPIVHMAINTILNDAEMSCDQKVLEKLEGEELRDYGRILLFMADEKYSKVVATTSIANGGKNIKKRIEAILFFKKYPKDLKVISYCFIAIIMCLVVLLGVNKTLIFKVTNDGTYSLLNENLTIDSNENLSSLGIDGIRANTEISAVDMYFKALINQNFDVLEFVTPSENLEKLQADRLAYEESDNKNDITYFINANADEATINAINNEFWLETKEYDYYLANVSQDGNTFSGTLVIEICEFDECSWIDPISGETYTEMCSASLIMPFEISKQSYYWVFEITGDYELLINKPYAMRYDEWDVSLELTPSNEEYVSLNCIYNFYFSTATPEGTSLITDYLEPNNNLVCENEYGSGYFSSTNQIVAYDLNYDSFEPLVLETSIVIDDYDQERTFYFEFSDEYKDAACYYKIIKSIDYSDNFFSNLYNSLGWVDNYAIDDDEVKKIDDGIIDDTIIMSSGLNIGDAYMSDLPLKQLSSTEIVIYDANGNEITTLTFN